ncbi:MAG: DUF523 domain-containing protein [Candidatus Cloacimonetes bacterium]|nr:DUF523 domain-containing protein [Candidatus Cloacimonadota bacterium]
MEYIIVSACLLGVNCKYDGGNNLNEKILSLTIDKILIPVCPEQLGGLPTPRDPAEIKCGKVVTGSGMDITENFLLGAAETLKIARLSGCNKAILKQRSPSCGKGQIYDGNHQHNLISGNGITTDLLLQNNFEILTEEDL